MGRLSRQIYLLLCRSAYFVITQVKKTKKYKIKKGKEKKKREVRYVLRDGSLLMRTKHLTE